MKALYVFAGALISLLMLASMAFAFYVFFDWNFAFVVVPVGAFAALLLAAGFNWWATRKGKA
jgi:hypothetical protein